MKRKFSSKWRVAIAMVTVISLGLVMATPVSAADGSGTCIVTPTEVVAGSTDNELTFIFTAAEVMDGGAISITAPSDWSAPQENSGTAGYTTADISSGTIEALTFAEQTVTVPITTMASGAKITVVYGDGGGDSGATAQPTAGTATFVTKSKVSGGASLVEIAASPRVTVRLLDHYSVTAIADPQLAGTAFDVTIQAEDVDNNAITSGPDAAENIAISFGETDAGATPTVTSTTAGTATVSMTMTVAQTGQIITFTGASGASGNSNSFDVDPGAIDHYSVTAIGDPRVAGTSFSVTIQAQDANDNDITSGGDAAEAITISFGKTDAGATPTSTTTAAGTATVSDMTMTVVQTGQTIIFTGDTSGKTGTSNSFDVDPGTIDHYWVSTITSPQVTDTAFSVTIQAQDANDNDITTSSEDIAISFGEADAGATPISTSTTDGRVAENMTMTVAQTGQTIIFTGASGASGTSNSFDVNHPGAIDHYSVTAIEPKDTDTAFSVTIQAQDANDNDIITGSEDITISFGKADAGATPTSTTTTAGTATVSDMTMTVAQAGQTIIFTGDSSGKSGTSNSFEVNPGAIDHYSVTAVADPQLAGTAFDVTIQAQDANDNDITTSSEDIAISFGETDAGATPISTSTTDGRVAENMTMTVVQTGQTIIFTGDSSGKTGTSNSFDVDQPGAIEHYSVTAIEPQDTDTAFSVTIQAQDASNHDIITGGDASEAITISFGEADAGATPTSTTTTAGTATVSDMTMTVVQTGQTITFTGDTSGATVTTAPFSVYDEIRTLNEGWTLISVDKGINSTDSAWLDEPLLVYKAAGSVFSTEVTLADLKPVEALYVKMGSGGGDLGIIYSTAAQGVSAKELVAGWNLISSAAETDAYELLSPLRKVQIGNVEGVGLTTLIGQASYNQYLLTTFSQTLVTDDEWTTIDSTPVTLNAFDGYWVYMNAAKSFGVIPD